MMGFQTTLQVALLRVSRVIAVMLFVLSSLYALVAYVPFTYQQVIRTELLPGQRTFVSLQPWMALVVALVLAGSMWPQLRARSKPSIGLIVYLALFAVLLIVQPVLPTLRSTPDSLVWSFAFLVPIAAIAVRDFVKLPAMPRAGETTDDLLILVSALCAGGMTAIISAASAAIRTHSLGTAAIFGAGLSVAAILLIGSLLFVVATFLRGIAGRRVVVETTLLAAAFAGGIAFVILRLAYASMSFGGAIAVLHAVVLAAVLVLALVGVGMQDAPIPTESVSGVIPLISAMMPRTTGIAVVALTVVPIAATALMIRVASMDWNFLVQQLIVVATTVVLFALVYRLGMKRIGNRPAHAWLFVVPIGFLLVWVVLRPIAAENGRLKNDADVARSLAQRLVLPPASADDTGAEFYQFLQQHANIPHEVKIAPTDVRLSANLSAATRQPPHIFVFVIDSLRRDYLSPYNPKVSFTPSISRFAAESLVFRNAFTHYGATGLSEPSIWVGGMLPHQQYIEPFYPMNALQKMLDADHYRLLVSRDSILKTVMRDDPSLTELDSTVSTKDYDLCGTLAELRQKLAAGPPQTPVFAYSQPQNIHISRITREGGVAIDNEPYTGFHAPYASRIKRIDGCFGAFVDFLHMSGWWDNSIVILTADHGDSLGEGGRWGHAYTIYPEVIRIPLIVHVPETLVTGRIIDPTRLAFSTDITPTLYDLLGHPLTETSPMFGRSLFPQRGQSQAVETGLIVSSYGPVFGWLSNGGRSLFIADAINYRDELFEIPLEGTSVEKQASEEARKENRASIEGASRALDAYYHVPRLR